MNIHKMTPRPMSILLAACVIFTLLLSACQPANVTTPLPPEQPTAAATPAQASTATQAPAEATQPPVETPGEISLDLSGLAEDQTVETVAAIPASAGGPPWEVAPEHRRLTLQGYPVMEHLHAPQIFLYPAVELAEFNPAAGKITANLQALLQSQQPGEQLPFLPLFNTAQVLHAQVQYLEFKSGKGVRFLTQFAQAPLPVNNSELIYTFQGLTSDGKYYIAAVLPVTHPDLPASNKVSAEQMETWMQDFPAYLTETTAWLEQQPSSSFTPDLAKLDALIQSIEVK